MAHGAWQSVHRESRIRRRIQAVYGFLAAGRPWCSRHALSTLGLRLATHNEVAREPQGPAHPGGF